MLYLPAGQVRNRKSPTEHFDGAFRATLAGWRNESPPARLFSVSTLPSGCKYARAGDGLHWYFAGGGSRPSSTLVQPMELDIGARQRKQVLKSIVAQALKSEMLEIFYQPIHSTSTGRFTSAEALLRLRHPPLGFIPPDEFIPIAEESGAIVAIGQFVLEDVCRFFSEHRLPQYGLDYVEVNLSVEECLQDNLTERILETLGRYSIT